MTCTISMDYFEKCLRDFWKNYIVTYISDLKKRIYRKNKFIDNLRIIFNILSSSIFLGNFIQFSLKNISFYTPHKFIQEIIKKNKRPSRNLEINSDNCNDLSHKKL